MKCNCPYAISTIHLTTLSDSQQLAWAATAYNIAQAVCGATVFYREKDKQALLEAVQL